MDLEKKTSELINTLNADMETKKRLLDSLSSEGLSTELLNNIQNQIDQSEINFFREAEKQAGSFLQELESLKNQLQAKTDANSLEEIRNKITQTKIQ